MANNKKLFALLEDPRFAHLVEPASSRRSARRSPGRGCCAPGATTYGEWVVDLLAFASDNRERLVLKPASDYGGHGVALGIETAQSDWDSLIEAHCRPADYVVQEYVPVPEEMFPTVEDGRVQMRLKRFNINPFGIGGHYAGMITSISDRAVINVSPAAGCSPAWWAAQATPARRGRAGGEWSMAAHEPLKLGYDVDDNADRFSNYFHVLRELVHRPPAGLRSSRAGSANTCSATICTTTRAA